MAINIFISIAFLIRSEQNHNYFGKQMRHFLKPLILFTYVYLVWSEKPKRKKKWVQRIKMD